MIVHFKPEDTLTLGAFLAGEGTITVDQAMSWSEKLGYVAQTGQPELEDDTPLMVAVVPEAEWLSDWQAT